MDRQQNEIDAMCRAAGCATQGEWFDERAVAARAAQVRFEYHASEARRFRAEAERLKAVCEKAGIPLR